MVGGDGELHQGGWWGGCYGTVRPSGGSRTLSFERCCEERCAPCNTCNSCLVTSNSNLVNETPLQYFAAGVGRRHNQSGKQTLPGIAETEKTQSIVFLQQRGAVGACAPVPVQCALVFTLSTCMLQATPQAQAPHSARILHQHLCAAPPKHHSIQHSHRHSHRHRQKGRQQDGWHLQLLPQPL